jgi:hypothetical protein
VIIILIRIRTDICLQDIDNGGRKSDERLLQQVFARPFENMVSAAAEFLSSRRLQL